MIWGLLDMLISTGFSRHIDHDTTRILIFMLGSMLGLMVHNAHIIIHTPLP